MICGVGAGKGRSGARLLVDAVDCGDGSEGVSVTNDSFGGLREYRWRRTGAVSGCLCLTLIAPFPSPLASVVGSAWGSFSHKRHCLIDDEGSANTDSWQDSSTTMNIQLGVFRDHVCTITIYKLKQSGIIRSTTNTHLPLDQHCLPGTARHLR